MKKDSCHMFHAPLDTSRPLLRKLEGRREHRECDFTDIERDEQEAHDGIRRERRRVWLPQHRKKCWFKPSNRIFPFLVAPEGPSYCSECERASNEVVDVVKDGARDDVVSQFLRESRISDATA